MDIFFEIHKGLPREGPGDTISTNKAFSLIKDFKPNSIILDIACGPGMQTIDLAETSSGKVIGLDIHSPFLSHLNNQKNIKGLGARLSIVQASMFELPFPRNCFDLIWSEGAIYLIGFESGLKYWKHLLKPIGYLAVTELSWLKPNPPEEIASYWQKEYPGVHTIEENLEIIQRTGFQIIENFTLPDNSWWTHYYSPMELKLNELYSRYAMNPDALLTLDGAKLEMEMHKKFSAWYGYEFYVMSSL